MGPDVVLESKSRFQARSRPKNVCTSILSSINVEERDCNVKLDNRYCSVKSLVGDSRKLSRRHSSSTYRESMPSEIFEDARDSDVLKRGSMYLSSEEVRRMRKVREGRRKVESTSSDDAFISFEIVNSLPQLLSNEDVLSSEQRHSPPASLNGGSKPSAIDTTQSVTTRSIEFLDLSFRDLPDKLSNQNASHSDLFSVERSSVDDLLEICLRTDGTKSHKEAAAELLEAGYLKQHKSECKQKLDCESCRQIIYNRNTSNILHQSYLAKVGKSNVRSQSESSLCNVSPKSRFSPLKRLFDPVMKSKSLRNSLLAESENIGSADMDALNIRKNGMLPKSIVHDYPKLMRKMESDAQLIGEDVLTSLPAHLHGILKLETISGNPSFEFSVKDPEDVLSAKSWRTDDSFNWVYTFHSSKNMNCNTWKRTKDKHGQSPSIVGQMQVSCYLCSEMRENGSAANSTVTEFILYDIVQARRSFAVEESSQCSSDATCPLQSNVTEKLVTERTIKQNNLIERQHPIRHTLSSYKSDVLTSYPWLPVDLHPELEIAAIVIQTPFGKKENSKDVKKEVNPKKWTNFSSFPDVDWERETTYNSLNSAIVKVITPSGRHGLPNVNAGGPSTLLDRWRYGGGCDCGGWDMGCPLDVFDNIYADDWAYNSLLDIQKPILLIGQGSKEKMPELSMMAHGEGQYLVDFHARFSSLQAFSICIAILHSSEASAAVSQEKSRQMLHSKSLKLLFEEEVRHMIEEIAVEDKRKVKNRVERVSPTFFLDPPFSPMARV